VRVLRRIFTAGLVALVGWAAFGAVAVARRAPRPPPPPGVARGAWHVHTTRSDGRGTLADVVAAARSAGLQFVVVTDHNVLTPQEEGWHDGVLVVEATEVSSDAGHVVALGVPRALDDAERRGGALPAIAALGGVAVLAHPFHPTRPWSAWDRGPWRGVEIVSNDTSWGKAVARRSVGKMAAAALYLPFDPGRAVLALMDDGADVRARLDAVLRAGRAGGGPRPRHVLFCSADAHGFPSYRAAFLAFSMHLPVTLTGDAARDVPAVRAALADGLGACVVDARAPAGQVRLGPGAEEKGMTLTVQAPDLSRARFALLRDGERVGEAAPGPVGPAGAAEVRFECGGGRCPPGDYRAEGTWDGRPWIFTNPVALE
jgi:hypothetical protein